LTNHQDYIVPEVEQVEKEDEYYHLKQSSFKNISKGLNQDQNNDKKRN
jgi:hypothetical protein